MVMCMFMWSVRTCVCRGNLKFGEYFVLINFRTCSLEPLSGTHCAEATVSAALLTVVVRRDHLKRQRPRDATRIAQEQKHEAVRGSTLAAARAGPHQQHHYTPLVAVAQGNVRGHMLLRGGDTPRDELRGERRAARLVQRAELALGVEEHVRVRVRVRVRARANPNPNPHPNLGVEQHGEAARGEGLLLGTRVLRGGWRVVGGGW